MRFRKALAATIGLSMIAAPVLAQSGAPLSLAPVGAQTEEGSALAGESNLIPALVLIGILAAAILYTSNKDSDLNNPASP